MSMTFNDRADVVGDPSGVDAYRENGNERRAQMSKGDRALRKRAEQIARNRTDAANTHLKSLINKPEDEIRTDLTRWLRTNGWKFTPKEMDEWVADLAKGEVPKLTSRVTG
jgi:hypothetical protein